MAKEQVIYSKATGLNFSKAPENLDWSPDGTVELAECTNCLIDDYGKITRAAGDVVLNASVGTIHTLFNGERQFIGTGTYLYERVDGTPQTRKDNCSGNEVRIVVVGGVAYCYDGVTFFTVKADGTVGTWAFTEKKGAVSSRPFTGPVAHTKVRKGFGRIFLLTASGVVFFSDPLSTTLFDLANNVLVDAGPIKEFECIKGVIIAGTSKATFIRVGGDFKQQERVPVAEYPVLPNTLCKGFLNENEVACFALHNGFYAVTEDGKVSKLTDDKVPPFFLTDSFIGASIVNNRYTVYSESGASYTVSLATKAIEERLTTVSKVSGDLAGKGIDLVQVGYGDNSVGSLVQFPLLSFGSSLRKSLRYLQVSGKFSGESTWTVADEYGRSSVQTIPATPTGQSKLVKVPVSCSVTGQFLSVSFTTSSPFKLESVHCIPVIKAVRG